MTRISDFRPGAVAACDLAAALRQCRKAFVSVGAFSALINVLMLTGPLFMLQVYDRVLPSRSIPTLVGFVVLVTVLYLFQATLEGLRSRILVRIGAALDESLSARVLLAGVPAAARRTPSG